MKLELAFAFNDATQSHQFGVNLVLFGDNPPKPTGWNITVFAELMKHKFFEFDPARTCFLLRMNENGWWVDVHNQIKPFKLDFQGKLLLDHSALILKVHPDGTATVHALNLPHLQVQGAGGYMSSKVGCAHTVYNDYKWHIHITKTFKI